jgi:hypothetical protein
MKYLRIATTKLTILRRGYSGNYSNVDLPWCPPGPAPTALLTMGLPPFAFSV